jgi:hypothetical protein
MENIDPEITEEDDILIWKLMKSLKEKTAINERDNNEDKTWSSSVPQEKCDWSYEKATLSIQYVVCTRRYIVVFVDGRVISHIQTVIHYYVCQYLVRNNHYQHLLL